jgi:dTDP-4-amino-4,6-dideoxygalactose transaminase
MKLKSFYSSSLLDEIENKIADYIGTRYAILCSSARSAIRYTLLALNIGPDDEVIIPDFSCQILPITVFCTGAHPIFCDIDKKNFTLSSEHISKIINKKTKAIIFTHLYGIPTDPFSILDTAQKRDIVFIDDAAQSLGASMNGKMTGSLGDVGIITFNKFLNVGLGGAVVTNNGKMVSKIKDIRKKYENKSLFLSLNYRIVEFLNLNSKDIIKLVFWTDTRLYKLLHRILAKKHFNYVDRWMIAKSNILKLWKSNSLPNEITNQLMTYDGTYWHRRKLEKIEIYQIDSELERLDEYLDKRRAVARLYADGVWEKNITKPEIQQNYIASYLRYPILFDDKKKCLSCIEGLAKEGFKISYRYRPLHSSPFFKNMIKSSEFENSILVSDHILPLPVDPNISAQKVDRIISIVNSNQS